MLENLSKPYPTEQFVDFRSNNCCVIALFTTDSQLPTSEMDQRTLQIKQT